MLQQNAEFLHDPTSSHNEKNAKEQREKRDEEIIFLCVYRCMGEKSPCPLLTKTVRLIAWHRTIPTGNLHPDAALARSFSLPSYITFSSGRPRGMHFPCPLPHTLFRCIDAFIIVTALINSFSSAADELEYYKNLARKNEDELLETRAMLEDFQLSSRELEEELEKEIDSTERRYNEIRIRNEAMKQEVEDWKVTKTILCMPDDDNEQERAGHQTSTCPFTFRVPRLNNG